MNAADRGEPAAATHVSTSTSAGSPGPADAGLVAVGRIGKAHGIRGDVFVEPWTDDPEERFADGAELSTDPP
jgi:16S rRNA processing protein RimM